jgi:hypothetical protein
MSLNKDVPQVPRDETLAVIRKALLKIIGADLLAN